MDVELQCLIFAQMGGSGNIFSILAAARPYFEVDKDGGQSHRM